MRRYGLTTLQKGRGKKKDLKMSDKGGINYNHSLKPLSNRGIVSNAWVQRLIITSVSLQL